MWPHIEQCVRFWVPQCKKDLKLLECALRRTTTVMKVLEGMTLRAAEDTWLVLLGEEKAESMK